VSDAWALRVVDALVPAQDKDVPQGAAQRNHRTQEVTMAGRSMTNGSMRRGAVVVLLAGGLVVGGSMPSLAATPLGRKPGASAGIGLVMPLAPRPGEGSGSGSNVDSSDAAGSALGRKPGGSSGSGTFFPFGPRPGGGSAKGRTHIGEEIPQHIGEEIPQ
jgi:hypothetical protein